MQRIARVDGPDEHRLDDEADHAHRHRRRQQAGEETPAGVDRDHGVGAQRVEHAVRHVDDAHQAERDGEADRHQREQHAQGDAVHHLVEEREKHAALLSGAADGGHRLDSAGGPHALPHRHHGGRPRTRHL